GRLVEEQQARLLREGPRDLGTLALPAREGREVPALEAGEPDLREARARERVVGGVLGRPRQPPRAVRDASEEHDVEHREGDRGVGLLRSEEHTSELQSRENLVCRLLLEKKK